MPLNIERVKINNAFLQIAKDVAQTLSLDKAHPTGAVLVQNNKIIGFGWNGSAVHEIKGFCERKKRKVPTGTRYDLCGGCDPHFHAERRAIRQATNKNRDLKNASMYLWGHWWCCQTCEKHLIHHGIANVYLAENAKEIFGKK